MMMSKKFAKHASTVLFVTGKGADCQAYSRTMSRQTARCNRNLRAAPALFNSHPSFKDGVWGFSKEALAFQF